MYTFSFIHLVSKPAMTALWRAIFCYGEYVSASNVSFGSFFKYVMTKADNLRYDAQNVLHQSPVKRKIIENDKLFA